MRAITTQHLRKHGFETAALFKQQFGLGSLKCVEMRVTHSRLMSERNPRSGKAHSEASRARMSRNRKGKGVGVAGKYERTPEIRARIAEGVLRSFEGTNTGTGHGSWIYAEKLDREVWTRSTWEARAVRVLDLHPCVLDYEVEPFTLPYSFDGRVRRYLPDFKVVLEGSITELWEVKPLRWWAYPVNKAKFAALNAYSIEKGWNARIVDGKQLRGMEMQVGLRPWVGEGGPWVRPDDPDFRPCSPEQRRGLP